MEGFFEFCAKYKVVDIVQIYKNYDYNLLRRIPIRKLMSITDRVLKEQKEQILFNVYLNLLSRMTKQTYISFSDFVAMTVQDNRSEEDIFRELEEMEKKFKKEDPDGTV